jgi:hypothetical protein
MAPDSPLTPAPIQTRIKWENVMIGLIALVVVVFGTVGYLISTAPGPQEQASGTEMGSATFPGDADTTAPVASILTLEDAVGLVEEARVLMREARWDEAADRLASVPQDLHAASGASALALELEGTRTRYEQLRAQFDAAIEARQWAEAEELFTQLASIATPNDELLAAHATAVERLRGPKPAAGGDGFEAAAQTTAANAAGGGAGATRPKPATAAAAAAPRPASTAPKPATQQPKPAAETIRPAPTSPGTGTAAGSSTAGSGLPAIALTPEQEAELAAALGFAMGELQ